MLSPHLFKTTSAGQTKKLAGLLVSVIANQGRSNLKSALIFALTGDLGTGKTTFIQGFLRGLGIKKRATSPTFIIIKKFVIRVNPRLPRSELALLRGFNPRKSAAVYHIDCYRIKKPSELLKLGLKEILNNSQNIVLIEWAEKIKRILPKNSIWVKFKHGEKENQRIIKVFRQY